MSPQRQVHLTPLFISICCSQTLQGKKEEEKWGDKERREHLFLGFCSVPLQVAMRDLVDNLIHKVRLGFTALCCFSDIDGISFIYLFFWCVCMCGGASALVCAYVWRSQVIFSCCSPFFIYHPIPFLSFFFPLFLPPFLFFLSLFLCFIYLFFGVVIFFFLFIYFI